MIVYVPCHGDCVRHAQTPGSQGSRPGLPSRERTLVYQHHSAESPPLKSLQMTWRWLVQVQGLAADDGYDGVGNVHHSHQLETIQSC